jgi:hypothetical protein
MSEKGSEYINKALRASFPTGFAVGCSEAMSITNPP